MKTARARAAALPAAPLPSPYLPATAPALRQERSARLLQGAQTSVDDDALRVQAAIGRAVRRYRRSHDLTIAGLAAQAARSRGMLSKIENGIVAPSIDTLIVLARALHVPVAAFFTDGALAAAATFLPAGQELPMRRGKRAGHSCRLIGDAAGDRGVVELHLVTLSQPADVFPHFKQAGAAILHMLEGEIGYRHGTDVYLLRAGDTLSFDAAASHGPLAPARRPLRCLGILCCSRD
jgi:transcriptional regulator with XRE-family HTH domain